jgi:hypothetical protein
MWVAHAFRARNLLGIGSMNFCFKWKHQDGSTIEFNSAGWIPSDPSKSDWLHGSNSDIPTVIRDWLKEECV